MNKIDLYMAILGLMECKHSMEDELILLDAAEDMGYPLAGVIRGHYSDNTHYLNTCPYYHHLLRWLQS